MFVPPGNPFSTYGGIKVSGLDSGQPGVWACIPAVGVGCNWGYSTIGPVAIIFIGNDNIAPDGFIRPAVLAGASPNALTTIGPLITGFKGDTFRLNVIDQLTDTRMHRSTAIHWHGFLQAGTAWADGGVANSQCPIIPGESFEYTFSSTNQAGTFWYHSHHSTQYCDGLRGALVVYDPDDPHAYMYDIDDESTVITLADWYHTISPKAPLGLQPNSTLINGVGRYLKGPLVPLAVVKVVQHKRYRFRLINTACGAHYRFSIDSHDLTIIEIDTVNLKPHTVSSIVIFPGQRYSFVVNANQPINNYWIRADPDRGPKGHAGGLNSAILRYSGAPIRDPTTNDAGTYPMFEGDLHPLVKARVPGRPYPGGADVNIHLDVKFAHGRFLVNGASFHTPALPLLLQIMNGTPAKKLLPPGSVYVLPPNKVIEISMIAPIGAPHPFHLHGHLFDIVRVAGSKTYNYIDPPKRDVVSAGDGHDNVTIRFVTDNPGPWIMHCHIDWHFEEGLSVIFAEDPDGTRDTSDPPPSWHELCPAFEAFGPEFPPA